VVNLERDLPRRPTSEPLLAPPEGMGWTMLWSSEDPRYKGGGTAPLAGEHGWQLPARPAVVLRLMVPAEPGPLTAVIMVKERRMPGPMPAFLEAVVNDMASRRHFPESTYRLQFHAGFTFRDACQIVPYLHALGITHCYASPFLQAQPGSTHGYDITNHQAFNAEIGTEADYDALCEVLEAHGMGQILDIVPNHMGVAGNDNQWWRDVLENGPASPYAGFFDIAWEASPRVEMHGKVLLPVLGKSYGDALESQEIHLAYVAGALMLQYFDQDFPVAPQSYVMLLEHRHDELTALLAENPESLAEYESILTAIRHLAPANETDPAKVAERQREKEVIKRRLATLTDTQPTVREFIEHNVALFNGTAGDPHSFDRLDALLQAQAYRLCNWRIASEEINYRRFFDINDLAALSMEKPEVFAATHELILCLLGEGKVHGVRIDHPDGLYDPHQYLQHLQQQYLLRLAQRLLGTDAAYQGLADQDLDTLLGWKVTPADGLQPEELRRPLYVVVEKILGVHEALRQDWPVYGTSGYDFLNVLNGLFVDADKRGVFTRLYRDWTQDPRAFADVVYDAKRLIMQVSLASEVHMLAYQLDRLAQQHRRSRDFTFNRLRYALQEVIAYFPVYRSYITADELHPDDRYYVQQAVARAQRRNPAFSREVFAFVRDMLLLTYPAGAGEDERAAQQRFVGKFQQVTAPVMAKGLEDTAFYRYHRLLSLNEVGNDADRFGVSPDELHRVNQERQATWPWALSALSTHDTKRSEDVRARLNVLSELPEEWQACLKRWSDLNAQYRQEIDEAPVPDAAVEYFLYQTLLGAWPLEPYTAAEYAAFIERIQAYLLKALHEAKVHTSWINPNPAYDEAVQHYVANILAPTNKTFLDDFQTLQRRIGHSGLYNSLAQTLLKLTFPGVPDTYQGTELWDFSLVDPDNRRPVDYVHRHRLLRELQTHLGAAGDDRSALAQELLTHQEDGRIKLYTTALALHCRRKNPGLFAIGDYIPAQAVGAQAAHVFGFSRRQGYRAAVVAVPRLIAQLLADGHEAPLGEAVWHDTRLRVPGLDPQQSWRHVFTGELVRLVMEDGHPTVAVADLMAQFPVALLMAQPQERV
jgi:(1->4)-alpha-D-glucan 1-alpha-D-glucosylmutase